MKNQRLSSSIGSRVNEADGLDLTVELFNSMFYECPLKGYNPQDPVTIGQVMPGNTRELHVAGTTIIHKMYSDILYGLDRDEFHQEDIKELDEMYGYPV